MKRHSDKKCYETVIKNLIGKKFIHLKDKKTYLFDYWTYEKGRLCLYFMEENDNSIYRNGIQLYYQHESDYKNTIPLIEKVYSII